MPLLCFALLGFAWLCFVSIVDGIRIFSILTIVSIPSILTIVKVKTLIGVALGSFNYEGNVNVP